MAYRYRRVMQNRTEKPSKDIDVVLAAYNRPEATKTVLRSLLAADYPDRVVFNLILSVDLSPMQDSIAELFDELSWSHGEKILVTHATRLGLKKHFFYCGSITQERGNPVVFIEDDLFLSPAFPKMTLNLVRLIENDDRLAAGSLYSLRINEANGLPFVPIEEQSSVFYAQLLSWGAIWTPKSWGEFINWHDLSESAPIEVLPPRMAHWPATSFKRAYNLFLVQTKRFVVFSSNSFVTNLGLSGQHVLKNTGRFQVAISLAEDPRPAKTIDQAVAVYDAYLDLLPDRMARLVPWLEGLNYVNNLSGAKRTAPRSVDHVLSHSKYERVLKSFGIAMKPLELNIVHDIDGHDIFLCQTAGKLARLSMRKRVKIMRHHLSNVSIIVFLFFELRERLRHD